MREMKRFLTVLALLLMGARMAMGQVLVYGEVDEQDYLTPIENATVTFSGIDIAGDTVVYQLTTDSLGYFSDSINAGIYQVWASAEGYQTDYLSDSLEIVEGEYFFGLYFALYEIYHPVRYVEARLFTDDLVRISWSMNDSLPQGDSTKMTRSFQYYDLFRSRFEEAPVLMASHLTDTVFMDMNWSSLPWGQYRWGVSCYYEGNRGYSDTIWSAYLDKAMTTTFTLDATTNVGLSPAGATVMLSSQNHSYQATLDADGHVLVPDVYRDAYDLRVHLDGFVDYVSDSAISIFEPTQVEIELIEATNGIDSLYVSFTGWAIWSLEESQNRDLQYFEIVLNGENVGQTANTSYQFEVGDLVAGDTCTAQVRPVYLSETGAWKTCQWVYRPCTDFEGPTNLSWMLDGEALKVTLWVPYYTATASSLLSPKVTTSWTRP